MLMNPAPKGGAIQVNAVAVVTLINEVGLSQVPVEDPLPHVLFGQGKGKAATGSPTLMHPVFTIDFHVVLKSVFVVFRVLEHGPQAPIARLLCQPFSHDPLALVEFLDGNDALLAQQFDESIEKGRCLEVFGGVGVETAVGVEQAVDHFLAQVPGEGRGVTPIVRYFQANTLRHS